MLGRERLMPDRWITVNVFLSLDPTTKRALAAAQPFA
jgi:hypothetical protein